MSDAMAKLKSSSALKRYYRILLSYGDFKHAFMCAKALSHFDEERLPEAETEHRAVYCSLVVAYSRPFNSSGGSRIGKIPPLSSNVLDILEDNERGIHHYILLCRNKLIAHTDAQFADLEPIVASDMPGEMVVPLRNDSMAPFTAEYAAQVARVCEKLWTWSVEERHSIEPDIIPSLRQATWAKIHGLDAEAV